MKPQKDPEGYKKLLVYKKADLLHALALELAEEIKNVERGLRGLTGEINKILLELADQIGRAARSPKSNIVEGWKRNSTKEYYEYLGFSIGSTEEMREDCEDIIKGKYKKLMGVKGITGEKGLALQEVGKLPFYPLDPLLSLVVRVFLSCKELSFLLYKLQESLETKMKAEGILPIRQKLKNRQQETKAADDWLKNYLK